MCIDCFAARYHQVVSKDDDGGQRTVRGRHGEIYTYDDKGVMAAIIEGGTPYEWKQIKRKLLAARCFILVDGKTGGIALFFSSNAWAACTVISVIEPAAGEAVRPMSRPLPKGMFKTLFPDWHLPGVCRFIH
jgi:hypothetical protein